MWYFVRAKDRVKYLLERLNRRILAALIILLVLGGGYLLVRGNIASQAINESSASAVKAAQLNQNSSGKLELKEPLAVKDLNKEYEFSFDNPNTKQKMVFKYTIEKAELRDDVIIKGQRATTIKGRTFLILNIKITNEQETALNINTRNYLRLTVNGNDQEKLAADIHNDPVEVQPQSTKYTRLGFHINESDSNFKLSVGEIDGSKEIVDLNF